jgi:hypothetical protein
MYHMCRARSASGGQISSHIGSLFTWLQMFVTSVFLSSFNTCASLFSRECFVRLNSFCIKYLLGAKLDFTLKKKFLRFRISVSFFI